MNDNKYCFEMKAPKNVPVKDFINNLEALLKADNELNNAIINPLGYQSTNLLDKIEIKDGNLTITLEPQITKL